MSGKACSVVVKAAECIVLAQNACQGIFGSLMGEQRAKPGQAFQSLGEELSTADRDVTETAQAKLRTKGQYCNTAHGGTHREWYNGNVTSSLAM